MVLFFFTCSVQRVYLLLKTDYRIDCEIRRPTVCIINMYGFQDGIYKGFS